MLDELPEIDVSDLDALIELKRERETLRQRLARLEETGVDVADAVLKRVRGDYETRLAGLERRAAEIKERVRDSYSRLKPLSEAAQRALEVHRLDEEELRLRQQLGEFDDEDYRNRIAQLEEGRKGAETRQAEIGAIVARFVGAVDSPADLDPEVLATASESSSAAAPPPAPFPADDENDHTWVTPADPTLAQSAEEPAASTPPPPTAPDAGVTLRHETVPPAEAAVEDGVDAVPAQFHSPPGSDTAEAAILSATGEAEGPARDTEQVAGLGARLQALDADIDPPEYGLEALTFIGRTPENHVRIYKPAVSRRHAQIAHSEAGWMLRDLSSENGTYVNGQRITERLLVDGDRVQFGTSRFLFKSA